MTSAVYFKRLWFSYLENYDLTWHSNYPRELCERMSVKGPREEYPLFVDYIPALDTPNAYILSFIASVETLYLTVD